MLRDRGLCLIVFLAIVGCGGQKKVRKPTLEAEGRTIRKVDIRGNKAISDSTLIGGLATRPPEKRYITNDVAQEYDQVELERDRRRIESYYQQRGYFRAKVTGVRTRNIGKKQVDVTITVKEGKQTKIRDVVVRGAPGHHGLTAERLAKLSKLERGAPLIYADYERAKRRIRAQVVHEGYAFARVEGQVRVDRGDGVADIDVRVDVGPHAVFGETVITGLGNIPERSVRARIGWKKGDFFDPAKLRKAQGQLYSLGVFSTVNMEYAKQARPEVADITVRLRKGKRHELKLGGGAGLDRTRYEVRGRAVYSERGFVIPLLTLRLEARPSYGFLRSKDDTDNLLGLGFEASAGLTKDDFLAPLWQGNATLNYTAREFTAYSIQGPQVALAIQRKFFGDRLRLGLAWSFRLQQFLSDVVPSAAEEKELGIGNPYRLGYFQQTIAYEGRDNPITPRRGIYAELRLEESGPYAGSHFSYIRVLPELRIYHPLGERIVLAVRGRFGRTLTGTVLPITERFFAGGASSQRGFALQRLSPRVGEQLDDAPVGGRAMVETSAEARLDVFPLFGNMLGIAGFIDGGDVTREQGDLLLSNLHWAAGGGLRYRTLIGPIRFDLAWRLNRKGPGTLDAEDTWAFHFSLGEAF